MDAKKSRNMSDTTAIKSNLFNVTWQKEENDEKNLRNEWCDVPECPKHGRKALLDKQKIKAIRSGFKTHEKASWWWQVTHRHLDRMRA